MVHFVPCKESMNAKGFARLFVDNVFKLHGLPKDMVSDRGPHFHNTFWHHVQKLLGMRGSLSSSYHPQSDGQTERYNRVLEEMLRHYISPTQADWPDYLSLAEFAVNNSWQESIKSTPFLVNTGQSPITPMLHSLPDKGRCPEGLSYATWWQEAVAKAKLCMQAAQQRQAAYANQDRRDVHYKVGQMVLLSTKNMRLKPGKARKLLPRFVGPFKVLDLVGQVAVHLQLPASMSRLHPVFHVSLIKPYTGTDVGFMPPPVEWLDEEPVYYVERLLDHRHVHAGKAKEFLVQWEGYDAHHNTWEPRSNLVGCDKILAEYNAAHNLNPDGSATPEPEVTPHGLPDAIKAQLDSLLAEYSDVFTPLTGLPPERPVGHTIPLEPGNRPPATPMYRLSKPEHDELKQQIQDLLAKGMIEPSSSPYAAPVLFVQKKSGELRMCIDYRQLNKITLRDQYPLPRIDDLFDKLSGCKVFSSLDLQAGYHQIRITPEDVPKTAFRTPEGHFQFKVLCFGLTNAPATFQRVMNDAFATVLGKCALVYLDDILVMSSRKLSPAEINYTTGEQEFLSLVTACKEWRCYLEGVPFTLFTDHQPLVALPTQKVLSRRQARWMEFMSRFSYSLVHIAGTVNPADPLSRIVHDSPESVLVCAVTTRRQAKLSLEGGGAREAGLRADAPAAISAKSPLALSQFEKDTTCVEAMLDPIGSETPVTQDETAQYPAAPAAPMGLSDQLTLGYQQDPAFTANADHSGMYQDTDGLWRISGKDLVVVPNVPELREHILHEMHDAAYAGHVGMTKTLERVTRVFWWNTVRADVRDYVGTCDACQRDKSSNSKPGGLLRPLTVPGYRWEHVSMDLVTKLPTGTHGYDAICVIVDRLSKMVHFVPCKESMNAMAFARLFINNVFKLHGLPAEVLTDRGAHFNNKFWHAVKKLLGMKTNMSTAYRPQSDGQTERYNRVLEEMLRHYISPTQADWPDHLALAEFAVNNSWQESIHSTPFFLNTGQSPVTPGLRDLPDGGRCPSAHAFATWWKEGVAHARRHMADAQARYKRHADTGLRDVEFEVGAQVLLSTRNLRIKTGKVRKFVPRYVGPFVVEAKINANAYRLTLPANMSRLHPVFHVSLLKKYSGSDVGIMPPPVEWMDETPVFYVERLLDHRYVRAGKAGEFLVQWEGYDASFNTWEPRANLTGCDKLLAEYNAIHLPPAAVPAIKQPMVTPPPAFLISAMKATVPMATAKVAARWLRKGGRAVVAVISPDGSATPEPEVTPHGLPDAIKAQLDSLLAEYSDVFTPLTGLPPERPVGHTIPLEPGNRPPATPMYRLSKPEHDELKQQIQDLLAKGMIEPSSSPYAAPVLFVQKKSGELRMCIDYRQLNKITLRDQYPLPRIDDLFDKLSGCKVFSSLDLQAGYHQIRITPEDVPKTAFRTPEGHFQFKVLCFGLTNAPATFQRVMNDAFATVLGKCALVYLDDILVMSSRKLSPAEINYTTGEQEFLSLVTACKEWRCYLEGVPFTLFTDHQPLVALPTQKVLSRRQARWMEFMSRFSYSLVHIAGTVNPADPLSRIVHDSPESVLVCAVTTRRQAKLSLEGGGAREAGLRADAPAAISAKSPLALSQSEKDTTCVEAMLDPIGSETPVTQDETAQYPAAPAAPMGLSDQLTLGYQQDPAFTANADHSGMYQDTDGLWRISGKDLVVVPNVPELREHILHEMHDAAYAGHVGMTKTLERVTRVFWWNTVRADVRDYVGTCDACQRDKSSNSKPGGLLRPLTVPGYRWEHVSMDLVTKLPTGTHGYDAICVIVDRLSKMVHFVPCKESMNAMAFARLFINNVFKLHGLPAEVLTDRGAHFNNKFWHAVKKLLGMKTNMSTAYRPQSDGQTERYNRVLEEMLRHYISPTQADWPDHLALAEFAVNNSWQESIHSTPFFLNTGQSPVTPGLRDLPDGGRCPSAHAFATWWKEGVAHARRHMADAQARYKRHADTGLRDVEFEVGAQVLLSTRNLRIKTGKVRKFVPRYVGPFVVEAKINANAYRLTLPANMSRLHPVFHVSLLKKYSGSDVGIMPPPVEWMDETPVFYVERLLDHRYVRAGKAGEFLVQWEGYDASFNTWEPRANLTGCDKLLAEYNAIHLPPAAVPAIKQPMVTPPPAFLISAMKATVPMATAKVAARWLRKGGRAVVAVISPDGSATPEPEVTPHGLPDAIKAQLDSLLAEYSDVFTPLTGLPPERPVGHTIPLEPGNRPPATPMYRLSKPEHDELKQQIQDLLAKGMIEPSSSPYAAPVLFVQKKSGELRMCIDYRQLNKITLRDQYPLPRIDDLFDKLSGCKVFSSLDLQAGYHQIRITPEDVPKTAFRTPEGHFQFKVLCFGLTNAPATFQRVMNDAFATVLGKCALVYLDDILVMSSRKLSPAEINYTTGEQEFLSLVTACKEWRCYLEGVPFTLFTDHQPLVALPTQKVLSRRQARWMEFMSRFSYSLVHIAGTVNPADPLSRIVHDSPESVSVCAVTTRRQAKLSLEGGGAREAGLRADAPAAISAKSPLALSQFEKDTTCVEAMLDPIGSETPVTQDETAQYPAAPAAPMGLSDQLTLGYQQDPAFTANADHSGMYQDTDGLWRISGKDLVVVPNVPELREHILHEMHDAAYAGHVGMTKTLERVTRVFWWNTVRADVRDYVGTCDACQRDKSSNSKPGGLLRPLTVPGYRWEHVSMDLVTKLPTGTHGYDAICVIVDRLSKMVHFVPCKESMNAMAFARLFINNVFKLHGLPAEVLTDRGAHFNNKFWHAVKKLLGMKTNMSTAYRPQSDGQTERYNRVLEEMLRHYISPTQADWPDHLALAEFAVNNSWQESIHSTPFFLNTGQSPVTPGLRDLPDGGRCPSAHAFATWWKEGVAHARRHMADAQARYKRHADTGLRDVEFEVGAQVLLSTRNLRIKTGKVRKFVPRYVGPFVVEAKINANAYRLTLPANMSRLHPVFHVSLLKKYSGSDVGIMPPPVEWMDETPVFYVERLLDHRYVRAGKAGEFLVQWEGYDASFNTWEPRANLTGCDKLLAEYNAIHCLK
ncbi:hypothetical protein QJQ45_014820 [Haematococcus lacustris]|nr:hypothetical protein QJQ45_014820 [Haematococcus lacustris]